MILLAGHNAHKLSELRALLAPLNWPLVTQARAGITQSAEEPHATFVENALAKARMAARLGGCAAIADDSGLCVTALGGAPGVRSARFAADCAGVVAAGNSTDAENNVALLRRMENQSDRRVRYVCALAALRHAEDADALIAVGTWPGRLLSAPLGNKGFGYDPLVWIEEAACSVAQMDATTKNHLSHRAQAARRFLQLAHENHWPD